MGGGTAAVATLSGGTTGGVGATGGTFSATAARTESDGGTGRARLEESGWTLGDEISVGDTVLPLLPPTNVDRVPGS